MSIDDSVDELNELYDIHLAHTALAVLRVTNPGTSNSTASAASSESATIDQIFNQWPDLPDRVPVDAQAVMQNSKSTPPQTKSAVVKKNVQYGQLLLYQVWRNDGSILFKTVSAPQTPLTQHVGFSDTQDGQGAYWRHYSIWDRKHEVRVIVSESRSLRTQQITGITLNSVGSIALGLPVLILLLWFSIKRGLIPLRTLSHQIAIRKPDNLAPLNEETAPWEVRPIVAALNSLLQRMAQAMESEKRFTGNAAHELRTPLAAIQAQLFAARLAKTELERDQAMSQVTLGIEKSIRLVSQMLTLARLDPEQTLPDARQVDLEELAQETCAELAPLALLRDQTIEFAAEPNLTPLPGNADLLAALLRNLLDNAIRYTQIGGHIHIDLRQTSGELILQVTDNGPGIPPALRERVFDRFYRIAEQSQPGTGLGLAICRRIAELHNAGISLSEGPNNCGVSARVTFAVIQTPKAIS